MDRVAQLVVQRVEQVRWRESDGELPQSARGTGGHGSTGGFFAASTVDEGEADCVRTS